MTLPWSVRRLRVGDETAWRELRLEMLADTPTAFGQLHATALARTTEEWNDEVGRTAAGPDAARFVAVGTHGSWLGSASGFAPSAPVAATSSCLAAVYVRPAWRGRGVLESLVDAMTAWSLAGGRPGLWLQVAAENPSAVAAYTRLGFVANGRTQAHPFFLGVSEIEMERPPAPQTGR